MPRMQLLEIEDQPWCPPDIRDGATDHLRTIQRVIGGYEPLVPKLAEALKRTASSRVVDLCSGGAGPWEQLAPSIATHHPGTTVLLTDRYPNQTAFERAAVNSGGRINGHPVPVDVTSVPSELTGFRTLFNAFHHFPPDQALRILQDAVRTRQGIGIFELVERAPLAMTGVGLAALSVPLTTPFAGSPTWSRLFWTYVVPAIPALVAFDGFVSCLRVYSPSELRDLVGQLGDVGYDWDIGQVRGVGPVRVTYLIGVPQTERSA